ncbi:hypothetical protein [Dickeya phage Sucellus]|nr:hypothetical protein [Dickeya phage Sucellus]
MNEKINENIIHHQEEFPGEEICGYVIMINGSLEYFRCKNISSDKENSFEISISETMEAESIGEIRALVHSHPLENHLPYLSSSDRLSQMANKIDWILLDNELNITTHKPIDLFKGRAYETNVNDCATIARDFYSYNGININVPHHSNEWWKEGKNIYLDNMEINGFVKVHGKKDIEYGDVLLINYASSVPNHSLIYVGNNKVLHHQMGNISKIDRLDSFWLKFCHSVWRHHKINKTHCEIICNRIRGE